MISIVDYGVGNLASIQNMLKRIGIDSMISSQEKDLMAADKLILPGVGAFDTCVAQLQQSGLINCLNKKVIEEKTPVLGVCVGMQLLLEGSEEGMLAGLGWIRGRNVKFERSQMPNVYKVPHMGWTDVIVAKQSKLTAGLDNDSRFYFVHSYHAQLEEHDDAVLTANYGYSFAAGVEHDNVLGVQFHPEKSHKFGMKLFENFAQYY